MQKTLSLVVTFILAFSPIVRAEDEIAIAPLVVDNVAVVETVSDIVPVDVIPSIEEEETVVDASSSSEMADDDQATSDTSLPIEAGEIDQSEADPIREEVALASDVIVDTLGEETIQSTENIPDIQEISPIQEEISDDIIVSETDTRVISVNSGVVTISWK